jgi:hypothetical protein
MVPDLEERIAFELAATPEAGWGARRALLAGTARCRAPSGTMSYCC